MSGRVFALIFNGLRVLWGVNLATKYPKMGRAEGHFNAPRGPGKRPSKTGRYPSQNGLWFCKKMFHQTHPVPKRNASNGLASHSVLAWFRRFSRLWEGKLGTVAGSTGWISKPI